MAFKTLKNNENDVWAIHTLAHIYEMNRDYLKGIDIL